MNDRAELFPTIEFRKKFLGEIHGSFDARMDGPVIPKIGVPPGTEFRPFLTDDNASGAHHLAAKELYATAFRTAIPYVRGRATSFLMRHTPRSVRQDLPLLQGR